jgi:hypothetical protein
VVIAATEPPARRNANAALRENLFMGDLFRFGAANFARGVGGGVHFVQLRDHRRNTGIGPALGRAIIAGGYYITLDGRI